MKDMLSRVKFSYCDFYMVTQLFTNIFQNIGKKKEKNMKEFM